MEMLDECRWVCLTMLSVHWVLTELFDRKKKGVTVIWYFRPEQVNSYAVLDSLS